METPEEFLNEFRQKLINNLPPIDLENPQKCFPGWWEDETVAEMMQEYAEEFYKDKLKDELAKFMEFEMSCSIEIGRLSDNKFIDEYLKQRP